MDIKPIRSDDDLTNAFIRLENIFQADEGTPEAEEMEIWWCFKKYAETKQVEF